MKSNGDMYWAVEEAMYWAVDGAVYGAVYGDVDGTVYRAVSGTVFWAVYHAVNRPSSVNPALVDFLTDTSKGAP